MFAGQAFEHVNRLYGNLHIVIVHLKWYFSLKSQFCCPGFSAFSFIIRPHHRIYIYIENLTLNEHYIYTDSPPEKKDMNGRLEIVLIGYWYLCILRKSYSVDYFLWSY
jgi:hypothetical protein